MKLQWRYFLWIFLRHKTTGYAFLKFICTFGFQIFLQFYFFGVFMRFIAQGLHSAVQLIRVVILISFCWYLNRIFTSMHKQCGIIRNVTRVKEIETTLIHASERDKNSRYPCHNLWTIPVVLFRFCTDKIQN